MATQLNIALVNTTSSTVYCNITGQDSAGRLAIIEADGRTPFYPPSPNQPQTAVSANIAIQLGPRGSTTPVTIPLLSAARVWFSVNTPLTFLLNPGPGLVEPSVTNPSDPNINILWGFCELTFNTAQLYANISYVDFVSLPIALSLTNTSGAVQVVQGLPQDGLAQVVAGLQAQSASDGKGWNKLVVNSPSGQTLRALSPNLGQVQNPNLFAGYFEPYVDTVWNTYTSTALTFDSQSSFGTVQGTVTNNLLTFPNVASFAKPSTADIFTCSTGPFQTSTPGLAALTPRISAAFNRSTLLSQPDQPSPASTYYQNAVTNHYARIVHSINQDGRGYAFPYDDVAPSGGADQSGAVFDPNPSLLTITIGGGGGGGSGPVPGASGLDAGTQIKAASYNTQNGVLTQPTSDTGGGNNVGWIANGDWIGFTSIDFGTGKNTFNARVASGAGTGISGAVQLVIDSLNSAPIAVFDVANTGGWQAWTTLSQPMTRTVSGTHAVYLTFASGQGADFVNVNWFTFQESGAAVAVALAQEMPTVQGGSTTQQKAVTQGAPASQGKGGRKGFAQKIFSRLARFRSRKQ